MRTVVVTLSAAVLWLTAASPAGAYLYWSDYGQLNSGGGTALLRANQDASGLRSPFVGGANGPTGVAVDGHYIYWADSGTNAIGRANLDGSGADPSFITGAAAPTSVTGRSPQGIALSVAVDGHFIYWTVSSGYVARANLDGTGKNSTWVDTGANTAPFGLAVTPTSIYVGLFNSILNVPIGGGFPRTTVASDGAWILPPTAIVYLGGYLYYTDAVGSTGTGGIVGRVPANDANDSPTPHTNSFITGLNLPLGLATDGTYLYWADNGTNAIGRAGPAAPADRNDSFIRDSGGPFGLAVDAGIDPTTTTVACTPASVIPGATTTCKATVTDSASSSVPTGLVAFSGNATTPFLGGASTTCTLTADAGGGASCVVGAIPQDAGTAPITAAYQGDPVHAQSTGTTNVCVGTPTACGAIAPPPPPAKTCKVPKLKGTSLKRAKTKLERAGCALGKVKRPRKPKARGLRPLIVASQKPGAGRSVPAGTKVALGVKERPRKATRRA